MHDASLDWKHGDGVTIKAQQQPLRLLPVSDKIGCIHLAFAHGHLQQIDLSSLPAGLTALRLTDFADITVSGSFHAPPIPKTYPVGHVPGGPPTGILIGSSEIAAYQPAAQQSSPDKPSRPTIHLCAEAGAPPLPPIAATLTTLVISC